MLDLRKKYKKAKKQAIKLMQEGRITEYMSQLTKVQTLKLQLIEARS